jgi:hypothetical protein
MNERIKELAIEALDYADKNHSADQHWFKVYNKKFAELIVKECIAVYEFDTSIYPEVNISHIKQHFGVTE